MIQAIAFALFIHVCVNFVGFVMQGSQPYLTTSMSTAVSATDTTIPVNSVTDFLSTGRLWIGGEVMSYTGTTTSCPAGDFSGEPACFTGVTRGLEQSTAISHASGSRVYNELGGVANDLSSFNSRTAVDETGELGSPWTNPLALVRFLARLGSWDWPMFEGDFAMFRIFGAILTIPILWGVFIALASVMGGLLQAVR